MECQKDFVAVAQLVYQPRTASFDGSSGVDWLLVAWGPLHFKQNPSSTSFDQKPLVITTSRFFLITKGNQCPIIIAFFEIFCGPRILGRQGTWNLQRFLKEHLLLIPKDLELAFTWKSLVILVFNFSISLSSTFLFGGGGTNFSQLFKGE